MIIALRILRSKMLRSHVAASVWKQKKAFLPELFRRNEEEINLMFPKKTSFQVDFSTFCPEVAESGRPR